MLLFLNLSVWLYCDCCERLQHVGVIWLNCEYLQSIWLCFLWDIKGKDPTIGTDSVLNITTAVQLAGMLHVKCFMHALNLASQHALKLPSATCLLGKVI